MMSEQAVLVKLEQRPDESPQCGAASSAAPVGVLKLRRPNRRQFTYAAIDVEALIPADHAARAIWELSGRFDLDGFAAPLRSLEGEAGRPAWEPRLLVSVWIWAYSEGLGSARDIERQCAYHPALQWLCGLETISHKTLSDFRTAHGAALDDLFTQLLALLSQAGLVDLEQVMIDGTRIRSQGSTSSLRRAGTIEQHLRAAREVVETMAEEEGAEQQSRRVRAARQRAARERVERLEQAIEELKKVEEKKRKQPRGAAARVSESEPEARVQRSFSFRVRKRERKQRRLGGGIQRAVGDGSVGKDRPGSEVDERSGRRRATGGDVGGCRAAPGRKAATSGGGPRLCQPGERAGDAAGGSEVVDAAAGGREPIEGGIEERGHRRGVQPGSVCV